MAPDEVVSPMPETVTDIDDFVVDMRQVEVDEGVDLRFLLA